MSGQTVFLRGQMENGGYLKIDGNGDLVMASELPQPMFHEETIYKSGKVMKRFRCVCHPTKYLTGNNDTRTVHGEPTRLHNGDLSGDSLWELESYNTHTLLLHVESGLYLVIRPKADASDHDFILGDRNGAVSHGDFYIAPLTAD